PDRLLQISAGRRKLVLRALRDLADHPPPQDGDDHEGGNDGEHHPRQEGMQPQEDADGADEAEDVAQRDRNVLPDDRLQVRDVVREATEQFTRPVLAEKGDWHAHQVPVDLRADVGDDALPEPAHEEVADEDEDGLREENCAQYERPLIEVVEALFEYGAVGGATDDGGGHQTEAGADDQRDQCEDEAYAVRTRIGEKSPQARHAFGTARARLRFDLAWHARTLARPRRRLTHPRG